MKKKLEEQERVTEQKKSEKMKSPEKNSVRQYARDNPDFSQKVPITEIAEFLNYFGYELHDFKETDNWISGDFFFIDFTTDGEQTISFSVDASPDAVSILSQRLSEEFGQFLVLESFYYNANDDEVHFGDDASQCHFNDMADGIAQKVEASWLIPPSDFISARA